MARTRTRKIAPPPLPRRRMRGTVRLFTQKADGMYADAKYLAIKNYQERQVTDPFAGQYVGHGGSSSDFQILPPHFDYGVLISLPNENHTLKQCIEAMATNIEGFGHRFEYIGPEGAQEGTEALAELERLEQLTDRPNGDYGILEYRKRLRMDKETIGACYTEVMRDTNGRIAAYSHVPGHLLRKTTKDTDVQMIHHVLIREGKAVKIPVRKQFRRYVQMVGSQRVYFKEFGDPRIIDYRNGKETTDVQYAATEIIEHSMYSLGHNYGLPRWINQLPAIIGSRECEVTNLSFFKDNAIPAMAVLVSGGSLTEDSVEIIEDAFTRKRGVDAMNRVLVIEALGDAEAMDENGRIPPPRIDMKPLTGERQGDGLFQEYDEANHVKIRSSFRLPPLFLGRAEDYTRASAEASLVVAETQVFSPERNAVDDMFNNQILLDENNEPPKYWRFRSNPARMTSPAQVIEALEKFDSAGALTPNVAIGLANELFNLEIEQIDEPWGDFPFELAKSGRVPVTGDALDDLANALDEAFNQAEQEAANSKGKGKNPKEKEEEVKAALKVMRETVRKNLEEARDRSRTVRSRKRTRVRATGSV